MALKEELTQKLGGKTLQEAENTEIYQALLQLTKERLQAVPAITGGQEALLCFRGVSHRKAAVQQPDQFGNV